MVLTLMKSTLKMSNIYVQNLLWTYILFMDICFICGLFKTIQNFAN